MDNDNNEIINNVPIQKGNKGKARRNVILLSRIMSIALLVFFILCTIGVACCFVCWIVSFFLDYEWIRNTILQHSSTVDVSKIDLIHAQYYFLCGMFACASGGAAMFMLKNAFRRIVIDKTPFSSQVVKQMVKAGITTLIVCAFIPLSTGITAVICNSIAASREFSMAGSWWLLIFGFVIFGLTFILKYGVELQEEADTTL